MRRLAWTALAACLVPWPTLGQLAYSLQDLPDSVGMDPYLLTGWVILAVALVAAVVLVILARDEPGARNRWIGLGLLVPVLVGQWALWLWTWAAFEAP